MSREISAWIGALAAAVIALVMTALVSSASASQFNTVGSNSGADTVQGSQVQSVPAYIPPAVNQGGTSQQTLTLPQARPQQSSPPPVLELPRTQPQPGATAALEVPVERQQTAVGRISITATDDSGRWIQDLRKQDISVFEDGTQRPVLGLQRDFDTPVSLGIVVDTSGSMAWKLPAAEAALQHFVRTLNPRDQVFLVAFSERSFLLQGFTDDPAALNHAISLLHAYGETALYDAVIDGLRKVEQGRYPKKALLVMTDGIDNASNSSLQGAIQAARRGGVLIYTVGLGTTSGSSGPMTFTPLFGGLRLSIGGGGGRGDLERVDASTLRTLADETGGTTFVMNPRVTNMSALDAHFQQISAELREQYTVQYGSAGGARPHQIHVASDRPGIEVRSPKWTGSGAANFGG